MPEVGFQTMRLFRCRLFSQMKMIASLSRFVAKAKEKVNTKFDQNLCQEKLKDPTMRLLAWNEFTICSLSLMCSPPSFFFFISRRWSASFSVLCLAYISEVTILSFHTDTDTNASLLLRRN